MWSTEDKEGGKALSLAVETAMAIIKTKYGAGRQRYESTRDGSRVLRKHTGRAESARRAHGAGRGCY